MKVKVLFVSKKNMKGDESMKIKSLLSGVCVVAISLALPCRADYTCVTNGFSFNYTVNADGKAVIQYNNGALFKGEELLIPAQLDGKSVFSLVNNAFQMVTNSYYETKRGRAFVENGPQEIGHAAFYTDGPGWDVVCVPGSVTRFSGAWCFRKVGKVYWTISSETLNIDQHAFSIAPYELRIVATCGVPNELHDKCYLWDCFGYYSSGYSGQTYYKCKKEHFEAWVARGGLDRFRGYVDDGYEYGKEAIVTFNVNGGDPLPSKTYRQGSPYAVLPTPTKLGYSFQGWRTVPYSEAGQEDGFAVGTDDVVAAPRETLYATWTPLPTCEVDDGTGGSGGKDSRFSSSGVYDGQGHGITVKVTSVANPKIAYSLAKTGPYVGSLLLTNACDATAIWYTVDASGYNTYTNWATVTITPRPVTLTSESASKKYDGRPLTNGEVLIGGDGFVGNEGVVFDVTGVQTEIGNSKNTFSYTLKPNTRAENYNISKVEGQLSVTDEWGYRAARLFVDASNGNDANDGMSWSRAKKTIQAAVDVSEDLDTILVADGTYEAIETANRHIAIHSVNGADRTFIDGGGINRCAYLGDSTNQVDTMLSGFTLKDGYLYVPYWDPAGAGVSGGLLRHCIITNCAVTGAWLGYGGNGGGAYGSVLEDCRLVSNKSLHGGGCFDSVVRRCLIADNYAKDDAGGASNCQVFDSVVTRNRSSNIGGGLSGTAFRDCLAYNCTVVSNISTAGAIVGSDLRNCLVTGNLTANGIPDDFRENDDSKNILSSCWTNLVSFVDAANGDFRFSGLIDDEVDAHPCVNAGDNGAVVSEMDLDGNVRIFDSVVDIGAYEFRGCIYKLKNYAGAYDGNGHSIQVTPCWPTGATVSYSLTREGPYATEPILMTNVCEPTKIWFTVVAEGHETVTNFGTVVISGIDLSAVTVELSETSFVYDGLPKMPTVRVNGEIPEAGACSISYANNMNAGTASVTVKGVAGFVGEVYRSFVIKPRPVTLTSKSAAKVYDGMPLTAHEVAVGGDGFVDGEGASYAVTGSQTTVGTSENTFTYALNGKTSAGNYAITTVNGTLTVTKASIGGGEGGGEPGEGDVPDGGLSKFDAAVVYDGAGHTIGTNALVVAFGAAMIGENTVEYAADDGSAGIGGRGAPALPWGAAPAYTNAGEYVVWYRVTNPNYEDFVHAAKVTIAKRAVTVRSRNLTKPYDGTPLALTADDIDAALTDGGQGLPALPEGESFAYGDFAERTAAGETPAIFTVSAGAGTQLANYALTVEYGTLTVTKAAVGPGGGGEPGAGDVPDGGLSKFDATAMYDGEGHTVDTNALVAAFDAAMVGERVVEYVADDGSAGIGGRGAPALPWGGVPVYTNAGEYVVWYRVTNPNYEDFVHAAKVTIAKRPVTVRSRSRTKPYDGTPLALTADDIDAALTDGGQGLPALPEGESFAYGDFAERTAAGETAATFTVSAGADTRLENYEVTAEYGTLTVTKATYPGQEPGGAGIAWSVAPGAATWMYDGRPHGVALTGVPAGVTARLAGHEAVDAGDYVATVALDYDAANYEPPAAPAPLAWSIARRPLTLMAASREKPYDGFPLAVRPGDITASGSGYADGECLDYFGFASITDVGETAATFSYRDSATAKVANYDVTVAGGQTLKVTVGGDQISVTADSATWAYDGEEHRAATWRVGNGDKLLAGHELRVEIDPASVVRTPADGPDGDGVVSNRFASVRIVEAATGADRTRNYNLVLKEGVLRMTNACIRAEQVFGADNVAKVYDGVATQVVVTAELLQPATVRYWADGAAATSAALPEDRGDGAAATSAALPEDRGDGAAATSAALPEDAVWSGEPPSFTHATNATVRFTVEADYYNAYTGRVDVAIAKRAVTLTTPTKAKTYDGAPLTFGADEVELVATSATLPGGDGGHGVTALPDGESFVFSDFAAIADAGRVPARCAYVAGTGTRLSDYAVTEDWGTLTVLASADEITVTADSATWAYDGTAHRQPSYTAENADKLQPGDALDVAFAPESVVLTPDDGLAGDGVVSNVITSVRVLRHGTEDVTRNYSLAWYPGVLRVTKARMTFDGEGSVDPSEFSTAATYDGAGHTVAVVPPSLLTAPVTVRYYGAVATSATLPARGDGAVATSATLPARGDGAAATSATLPVRGDGAVATSATLPEEAAWSGEAPAFTNAGVHTVFYALDARHYETYFGTATVTIAPRPVTLVSDGAEKVYDGTPLRCGAVRVKDGSPGFVDGEGFAATCSGALTDVGAMENLFDYALTGGALAGNYAVTKEYGWLRVTPATLDPGAVFGGGETDADGGPLCARVYNGAPQPFAPAPDFGEPYRLSYALVPGDESAYSETAPTRTHVAEGDLTVYFKFLSPNYAPYYGKGTLRIVPKTLTEEMCVADEDAAWFFDGTEKRPAVTVVDGDPNIATADDYTLAYSGRTGAGLFPVTVTGTNDYCGVVTKEFAILKRPVAPPVIPSRAYSGRLQRPTIAADARWTVVANSGGTDAGSYTNVVLRLANTADYKWKGLGGDEADWTGVFEIRRGANGWSTYPGIRSWTNGVEAAGAPTGRARFGTLSVAYRRRGAPVASETAERPSAPGRYTARFWVAESKNYAGVGLAAPYDVDFEIFRGPDDPPAGDATTTTPVPVPYAWLDAYVGRFGGGDYEAAAHAPGANGVALWESYVAGLDPADAASRFTASIALGADGVPRVTWSPDLRAADPPRAYTVYGKPTLGAAAWTPVTDANRAAMRFFKVAVEVR